MRAGSPHYRCVPRAASPSTEVYLGLPALGTKVYLGVPATVHWRAGYEEKKFAAVIPVLSASNNVPKPKNIDFQIST